MKSLIRIIDGVIQREGGYVDHPNDLGGPTAFGITERVAREEGYTGPMPGLPRKVAFEIYWRRYIERPGFGEIAAISEPIAEKMIDIGVNMGVAWPAIFLQRALNAFNLRGKLYPDLAVDGACGPATRSALYAYLEKRGSNAETVMLRALNAQQGARYLEITEARAANESFAYGWFAGRVA